MSKQGDQMRLEQDYLVIEIIIGILGIFGMVMGGLWKWWPRFRNFFRGRAAIVVVKDNSEHSNYWHIGQSQGKPILQIAGSYMLTNITEKPIALAKAELKGIKGQVEYSDVTVKDSKTIYHGHYDIPAHSRTSVDIIFMIIPEKEPEQGSPIQVDVAIVDQFGKKYWIKKANFRPG